MTTPALILASASAIRAQILTNAGVRFQVVPADIDEDTVKAALQSEQASPEHVAQMLAEMKALKVSRAHPDALVIGADQLLVFEGEIISKSADLGEAHSLLNRLWGKEHQLIGATVLAKSGSIVWRNAAVSRLWMREFSDDFLQGYVHDQGLKLLTSVGCYQFEGLGAQLFSRVEGDYFSILGLPLLPLLEALREHDAIRS
jgi:septum formation protein